MKVLLATPLYPPQSGGPATYTKLLEERLPKLGFEVEVLPFSDVQHLPKLIRHAVYFWRCFLMARKSDMVYTQDTVSVGLPAAFASVMAHKKFVVRVPGDYAWEQGRQRFGVTDELDEFQNKSYGLGVGFLRLVQHFVVHRARAVVVPSEYIKKIVGGWGVKNIFVIYSSIEELQPAIIARPEKFLVVSAGRNVPWKGFDALKRVVAREPHWALKICENMPREQALGWIKAADVFVLNSTYEGLSHVLVEAMTLGTPIVTTNVGGNPELIKDGVDGLLVPPKDDEALFAAIKKIEANPVAARMHAEAARAKSSQFSIQNTIGQIAGLLKTI